MDEKQFSQFMMQQQKVLEQMQQLMLRHDTNVVQNTPQNGVQSTTVNLQNFDAFDITKETYKNYIQRFKNYVDMKGIADNKEYCAKLLLNSIGAKNFNMVAALASPRPLNDIKYDELLQLLEGHLSPKKNVLVVQHQFLSKYQMEKQSISEFVATLRADISECEFVSSCECKASVADLFLRAQFIRGIADNNVREQLLQSESTEFSEVVAKAIALEAAKVDAREITMNAAATSVINQVSGRNRIKGKNDSRATKSSNQHKVNYRQLGIEGLCMRCGRNNHFAKECRTDKNKLKCTACNKNGHVSRVCITTLQSKASHAGKSSQKQNTTNQVQKAERDSYGVFNVVNVYQNTNSSDAEHYYTDINIEGEQVTFEVDSGSAYTFLPRSQFKKLNLNIPLSSTNIAFRSYTQTTFVPDGKIKVRAKYNNVAIEDEIYIVPDFCSALLGRTWIRRLKINLNDLDNNTTVKSAVVKQVSVIDDIVREFDEVFREKIGCTPEYKVSLKLRENATPCYTKERAIPYSLTERVERELDVLEQTGIISKTTDSDWGSPLVVIPKADGGVRLCVDYKVGVNQRLIDSHYPIRKIGDIFNSLRDSKFFCRLDLYKAYLHIPVDEQSTVIQTISTHRGTYRMNRLSFGIKTAPAEFNRIIDQILREIPKTESYFDDIIVHGSSMDECKSNLKLCLAQLKKFDLHLNRAKCSFFKESIEFLGHVVEFNKIKMAESKVSAILDMPRPNNADDVRRFLGMVTYYARFIPNLSSITTPLRRLLKKDSKFKWTNDCEKSFKKLRGELASDRVLTPYNPGLPLQLACDAGPTGIAGILSHIVGGHERPIAYASRALTSAEQNYSQLDREALAIVFSVQHFHEYLFARPFKLITDNQPIMRIFHQNAKLPQMTSARLQRYAAFLSGFNYEIECIKGVENTNADCLSRAPDTSRSPVENLINQEVHLICSASIHQISSEKINFQSIRDETCKDKELVKILNNLRNDNKKNFFSKNYEIESEYTIDGGVLFRGQRAIIPTKLQPYVLKELHSTHLGITKMKQLARRYVYWKSIDKDIENLVRCCQSCAAVRSSPPKAELHPWEEPDGNWQRVHMDYAGPFQGYYFLVVIDAKSKWAEVGIVKSAPSSFSTIEILQSIFSRNGFPNVLVSDNATIFTSEEFKTFCKNSGIFQKFIAPGHPATNGLAERNVQTLKHKLTAMEDEKIPIREKVQEILFKYRATPLINNKTPSEQYLGRQIRIRLDAFKPAKFKETQFPTCMSRQLVEGERVQARYYATNKAMWKLGTITKKLGNLHYIVTLDNGFVFKRHINQLRSTNVPPTVSDNSGDENDRETADREDIMVTPQYSTGQNLQLPISQQATLQTPQPLTSQQASAPNSKPSTSQQASLNLQASTSQEDTSLNLQPSTSQQAQTQDQQYSSPNRATSTSQQIPERESRVSSRSRKLPHYLKDYVVDSD